MGGGWVPQGHGLPDCGKNREAFAFRLAQSSGIQELIQFTLIPMRKIACFLTFRLILFDSGMN